MEPGVLYFGSLPPFMKPQKLRHLLEQHGEVSKLYMVPEDNARRKQRIKRGGSSKIKYIEGWVEFTKKSTAKKVAAKLNAAPIGGRNHRNFHFYDAWCVKYLSGFRWEQLTEALIFEKKTREAKLRNELSKAKKENEYFLQQLTKGKAIQSIIERKQKKERLVKEVGGFRTNASTTHDVQRQIFQRHSRKQNLKDSADILQEVF